MTSIVKQLIMYDDCHLPFVLSDKYNFRIIHTLSASCILCIMNVVKVILSYTDAFPFECSISQLYKKLNALRPL